MTIRSLLCIVAIFALSPLAQADIGNYLNYAILTLPARFLADIPLNQRDDLLEQCSYEQDDNRLDYKNGFLNYFSDSEEPPAASSMFYLKILPAEEPFVFVHMQKPFNGTRPSKNDTFVVQFMGSDKGWVDITDQVFPKGIDRKSYFHPLRTSLDIEVAPWVRRGSYGGYSYGECKTLIRWNGKTFVRIPIKPRKVGND